MDTLSGQMKFNHYNSLAFGSHWNQNLTHLSSPLHRCWHSTKLDTTSYWSSQALKRQPCNDLRGQLKKCFNCSSKSQSTVIYGCWVTYQKLVMGW